MTAQASSVEHGEPTRLRHHVGAKRIWIGIAVAAVGIASLFSFWTFVALVAGIAVAGAFELGSLSRHLETPIAVPVVIAGSVAFITAAILPHGGALEGWFVVSILLGGLAVTAARPTRNAPARVAATLFASLYLGKLFAYYVVLRGDAAVVIAPHARGGGIGIILWIIIVVALTDTVSMFAGLAFGRRRLWPQVSPSKTWEGAIVGFFAATAAGAIWGFAAGIVPDPWRAATLSMVLSLAAIAGDLFESALKRWAHVKDVGHIIAGHGGVLDRFDSYVFVGAVAYCGLVLSGSPP